MLAHGIHLGQGTEYAKEMRKHEALHSPYGPPGRPYTFREYPSMMYKPTRAKDNGDVAFEAQTAEDDRDRERLERSGFIHGGKAAALAALERREFEFAELAANRAVTDRRMGELARVEAERVDTATIQHLPVIPEANARPDHMKGKK